MLLRACAPRPAAHNAFRSVIQLGGHTPWRPWSFGRVRMERMREDAELARYQMQVYQKRRDNLITNMNRRLMARKSKLGADMIDPSGAYLFVNPFPAMIYTRNCGKAMFAYAHCSYSHVTRLRCSKRPWLSPRRRHCQTPKKLACCRRLTPSGIADMLLRTQGCCRPSASATPCSAPPRTRAPASPPAGAETVQRTLTRARPTRAELSSRRPQT